MQYKQDKISHLHIVLSKIVLRVVEWVTLLGFLFGV